MCFDSSPVVGVASDVRGGRAIVVVLVLLGIIGVVTYTGYAGFTVYRDLDRGGQELASVMAGLSAADRTPDASQLDSAARQLRQAEADFAAGHERLTNDPALRVAASFGPAGEQIDAGAHLAAIGVDLSRAGESADVIAIRVATLEKQYEGRTLTTGDLEAAAQQAMAVASNAQPAIEAIGQQLQAAKAERAKVMTSGLVGPLRTAYVEVDQALAAADAAFASYEDVRGRLSTFLGVPLPA
jgi:hypothetical protein